MARQLQAQAMVLDSLDSTQQVEAQTLKEMVADMMTCFKVMAGRIKGGQLTQSQLLLENETAVALLSTLASSCRDLTREKKRDVLMVGYEHLLSQRKQLDGVSSHILSSWIDYAEAALLSKPVSKLQLTRQTLEFAEKCMAQGATNDFMSDFLGAQHEMDDMAQQAHANAHELRQQHQEAIGRAKSQYARRQKDGKRCPTAHDVYRVSGGAHGKDFAHALVSKRRRAKQGAAKRDKQATAMEVDQGGLQLDCDAVIVDEPRCQLLRNGKPVAIAITYPYPCQVLGRSKGMSRKAVLVQLAHPVGGIQVEVRLSNLERNPSKAAKLQRALALTM